MINIAELEKKFNSLNKFNLVFASFFFSLMTLCVKNIDKRIPIYELVLFRSLLSLMITLFIIKLKNINPWGKNKQLLILRGVLGTLALICIFYAIRNMPLSISTVIQYTYPIFISIFAVIFINEKVTGNLVFALDEALKMMREEGLDNIFLRHNKHKLAMSNAVKALNLKLFADEKYLSPSITAVKTEGIDAEEFRKTIKNNFDILLAGGQDHMKGKIFRVGHLGYVNDRDIITVVSAMSNTLLKMRKITAQQAGEALVEVSKYLEEI